MLILLSKSYIGYLKQRLKQRKEKGEIGLLVIAIIFPLWWLFLFVFFTTQYLLPYLPNTDLLSRFQLPTQILHTKEITIQEDKLLIRLGFPFNRVQINDMEGNNVLNFSPRQHIWTDSFFVVLPDNQGYIDCISEGEKARYNLYDARGYFVRTERFKGSYEGKSTDLDHELRYYCEDYQHKYQTHNKDLFDTLNDWSGSTDSALKDFIQLHKPIYSGGKTNTLGRIFKGKYAFSSILPFQSNQLYRIVTSNHNGCSMVYTNKEPSIELRNSIDYQHYLAPLSLQEEVRADKQYKILNDVNSSWQIVIVCLTNWISLFVGTLGSILLYDAILRFSKTRTL